jgi:hypothetical protein
MYSQLTSCYSPPLLCTLGRRRSDYISIDDSDTVPMLTTIRVSDNLLLSRPPPSCLFSPPRPASDQGTDVFTIRIARGKTLGLGSTLGVMWDHALSDVGGIAQLLSFVSALYSNVDVKPLLVPTKMHHDRSVQPEPPLNSSVNEKTVRKSD